MKNYSNVHNHWSSDRVPIPIPNLGRYLQHILYFYLYNKKKSSFIMEIQERKKYTEATIKKLPKKNQKYDMLDSEVIGLRIYVQTTGEKSFYLQMYIKEF
jgi:hypothetical protein